MVPPLPMPQLLERWSELLLADVPLGTMPTRAARESGSLLREPATDEEVQATEARLGRRLPPSYREFLLASDGAYGDRGGATRVHTRDGWEPTPSDSPVVGVGLFPCADLRWLRDVSSWEAELYEDTEGDAEFGAPVTDDGQEPWPWTPMADGLVIGRDWAPGRTCLVPVDGVEEWQVWEIVKESAIAYLSFRSFLEYEVELREPVRTLAEVRDVIARADSGDALASQRLSRTTAPGAVPLLVERVDPRWGGPEVLGLGRIGTPDAVDALARLRPRGAEEALTLAGTDRARDVLAEWGATWELSLLGDVRAGQIAAREIGELISMRTLDYAQGDRLRTAVRVLGASGDAGYVNVLLPLRSRRSEPWVAVETARALAWLGAPEGRELLEELAAGDDQEGRSAAFMLGRMDEGYLP